MGAGFYQSMTWNFIGISPFNSEPDEAPTPVFEVPDYVPSPAFEVLTGTPEADTFELDSPGFGTQSLDDNFIAMGIPIIVDSSEDSEVDLLFYQEKEGPYYIPGFTNRPARSFTYIQGFDPIEDEIIVGGKPYMIEIDDEILDGEAPTMPGPVLLLDPGDELSLNFKNDIRIPGLTDQQLAQAGFIPNSTPGSTASNGLGGTTSTNTHIHGAHVNSVGFGDNVVSRFTTGQQWTTEMDFSPIHAQGSYF